MGVGDTGNVGSAHFERTASHTPIVFPFPRIFRFRFGRLIICGDKTLHKNKRWAVPTLQKLIRQQPTYHKRCTLSPLSR